jgi:hypothetical protein
MKEIEQRITIAKVCGWTQSDVDYWISPSGIEYQVMHGYQTYKDGSDILPDYLHDLNAIHEAEKILEDNQRMHFRGELVEMMRPKYGFESACLLAIHATAAQRAEAFLRTLNLWKD